MSRTEFTAASPGDLLSLEPYTAGPSGRKGNARKFLLEIKDEAITKVLLASLPMLERALLEKTTQARERRIEAVVDFMAGQMVLPSAIDNDMAQRLAKRHARVLNEFGYFSAEELAEANRSQASSRTALADNWRKRRLVFAVPHPDKTARERDVYPAFQFEEHKPIKAVQSVLEVFGDRKGPWKLALWFTSNNGWLPDDARPVDLLASNPQAVIEAAQREAEGAAA